MNAMKDVEVSMVDADAQMRRRASADSDEPPVKDTGEPRILRDAGE